MSSDTDVSALDWLSDPSCEFSNEPRNPENSPYKSFIKPIEISGVHLPNNLALAPMAGVTDGSFRLLCSRLGAGYSVSELASSKAILMDNPQTIRMVRFQSEPGPYAVQIFGADPATMAEAARRVESLNLCDIIDINMGCPVPKVVKTGAGSALMKTPNLAANIIKSVVSAVSIPVTVKYRIGWSDSEINVIDFTKNVLDAGAKAVTIHARTRKAGYTGKAQWEYFEGISEICGSIPFFANGDITEIEHFEYLYKNMGCDGFMLGRGVVGRPWLFSELLGRKIDDPELKFKIFRHHLIDMLMEHGPKAVPLFRVHLFGYIKNHPNAAKFRQILSSETDPKVVLKMGKAFFLNELLPFVDKI